jgi:E3 ubiquitin-protein ligase DOA10
MLGGAGFVMKNFVAVLAPQYDSMAFVLPMFVAMVSMAFWFLVKGIDRACWEQLEGVSEKG